MPPCKMQPELVLFSYLKGCCVIVRFAGSVHINCKGFIFLER